MTVSKFWRNIPQYYNLIGKRCPRCNSLFFPPRDVCQSCGNFKLEDYKYNGKGTIVTFTIIRTPISDPEGEVIDIQAITIPYALAIIKLDEGPKLTTQLVDINLEDIKIGQKVEAVFRKICEKGPHGVIQYGYKFRPVR